MLLLLPAVLLKERKCWYTGRSIKAYGGYKKMAAMHVKHAAGAIAAKMAPFGAETAAPTPHEGEIKHTICPKKEHGKPPKRRCNVPQA